MALSYRPFGIPLTLGHNRWVLWVESIAVVRTAQHGAAVRTKRTIGPRSNAVQIKTDPIGSREQNDFLEDPRVSILMIFCRFGENMSNFYALNTRQPEFGICPGRASLSYFWAFSTSCHIHRGISTSQPTGYTKWFGN